MPYKSGKLKGELTAPELRRMIKEHNKLMSIKIPPKTDRDGLIKLINDNGYKVNHEAQKLIPSVQMKRKPTIKLPPAPTPKTAEEKADAKKQKKMKAEKKEEEAFDSRKKKIDAIKKIRDKKKSEPKKSESESDKPTKDDLSNYQKQVDDNIDNMKKLAYIRGLIFQITERYTRGTKLKPTTDFIYGKRMKEPIIVDMLKLVEKIDGKGYS